jgi:hypothetical protein
MPKIVPLVEGYGEVDAVPLLLRRGLEHLQRWDFEIARPRNAHGCGNLTKPNGLEKFMLLCLKEPDCSAIFVLMDIDAGCATNLAHHFSHRIRLMVPPVPVVIVFARREYESWFLASISTLAGKNIGVRLGLPADCVAPGDPESIANPKAWLTERMPQGRAYKETEDQAPMTHSMDHQLVSNTCRSFRRFQHAIQQLVQAVDQGQVIVSP